MVSPLLAGVAGSTVGGIVKGAKETGDKVFNQAVNIGIGKVDIHTIFKWSVYLAIIFGALLLIFYLVRDFAFVVHYFTCGLSGLIGNNVSECKLAIDAFKELWLWEIEWYLLTFFYYPIAFAVGIMIYQWFMKLVGYLLKAEYYIKQIEDWIYGFSWQGEAEQQMTTRL